MSWGNPSSFFFYWVLWPIFANTTFFVFLAICNVCIFVPGTVFWWYQAYCHGKTLCIFVKFEIPAKLMSSSLPVSPSRVLRAPGTSLHYLVPSTFGTGGPGLSNPIPPHLLLEACSDHRQHQRWFFRWIKRPYSNWRNSFSLQDSGPEQYRFGNEHRIIFHCVSSQSSLWCFRWKIHFS